MKHYKLHEIAKFASGLIAADFIGVIWFAVNGGFPMTVFGVEFTSEIVWPALIFDAALFLILVHYGWHIGKTPRLRERTYLFVAGSIFGIVALAHLMRAFFGADLSLAGWAIPLWLSWTATVVTAYLAYMSFHLALRMR